MSSALWPMRRGGTEAPPRPLGLAQERAQVASVLLTNNHDDLHLLGYQHLVAVLSTIDSEASVPYGKLVEHRGCLNVSEQRPTVDLVVQLRALAQFAQQRSPRSPSEQSLAPGGQGIAAIVAPSGSVAGQLLLARSTSVQPVHVPLLGQKLEALFSSNRNPDVKTQVQLAACLSLQRSAISNWINGSGGSKKDHVPAKHFQSICRLFQVEPSLLESDISPRRFELAVAKVDAGWVALEAMAVSDASSLFMFSDASPACIQRGVEFQPSREADGPVIRLGETFRVSVEAPLEWDVVLLLRDPLGVTCCHPRDSNPESPAAGHATPLIVPDLAESPLVAVPAAGEHCWIALTRSRAWSKETYSRLNSIDLTERYRAIESMAWTLQVEGLLQSGEARILKLPFRIKP